MPVSWVRVLLSTMSILLVASSAPSPAHGDNATAAGSRPAPLRVCACQTTFFRPADTASGAEGFEADLLAGFAASMGREPEVVWLTPCGRQQAGLEDGSCDVVASRITWTEARTARYALSDGYLPVRLVLVRPASAASEEPLAVAVLAGTIYEDAAKELLAGAELVSADGEADMFAKVAAGEADALVCDTAVVLDFIADWPTLAVSRFLGDPSHYSFALAKGSPLLEPLNRYLARLQQGSEYHDLLERHFGRELADMLCQR